MDARNRYATPLAVLLNPFGSVIPCREIAKAGFSEGCNSQGGFLPMKASYGACPAGSSVDAPLASGGKVEFINLIQGCHHRALFLRGELR